MELLRDLTRLQQAHGFLDDDCLQQVAKRHGVPLYRVEGLVEFYPSFRRTPPRRVTIEVCRDVTCNLACSDERLQTLTTAVAGRDDVEIHEVSCLGRCDTAPAASLCDVPIAPYSLADDEALMELIARPPALSPPDRRHRQVWKCNPYEHKDAHYATVTELAANADALGDRCIAELQQSGLSGMGGAGFPTGRKWEAVRHVDGDTKYVICNADESEPGTFKDRVILEQLPHLVIEGMVLAGLTIGATQGIVYLRHEYSPERLVLEQELETARQRGILGDNAAGSGQPFNIEIFVSPGGYILGEETALLEALEDKRGEPRNKPPYPSTHGLWGKPTLINNVETLALSTSIIHFGSTWWQERGQTGFAGLKFVSISGDVERPGVYEIPVGTSVADLIESAGGMRDSKTLKAFLPGGASSNFLTAAHVNTPLDFDSMKKAGSMLGTGAVIVIAEGRDLFHLATNIVTFFRNESCGKCVPCRTGSEKAVQLLQEIITGKTSSDALTILSDMGATLEQTSICGLGQVALNPVLSMLQHFPDEVPTPS